MRILFRYGEIGLKSKQVRQSFERRLLEAISKKLSTEEIEHTLAREDGRFFVLTETEEKHALDALAQIPGIVSFSPVMKTTANFEEIFAVCRKIISRHPDATSFALRTRRYGTHAFTSRDVAIQIGQMIVDAYGLKVDLTNPELEIHIEVRNKHAYLFTEIIDGVGGLPVHEEDAILARMSSQSDMIAAFLLLRRGCKIIPFATQNTEESRSFVDVLKAYDPDIKLVFGSDVSSLMELFDCKAMCVGTTVETVGEDSFPNGVAVLEPCCAFSKEDIVAFAENIS